MPHLLNITLACCLTLSPALSCSRSADPSATYREPRQEEIHHEKPVQSWFRHGLVYVIARLNNRALLCLVDTGATASAIHAALADELGLADAGEVTVEGTTGTFVTRTVTIEGLTVGAFETGTIRATAYDLAGMLHVEGRAIDMILGFDAFAHLCLTLDFENMSVGFARSAPDGVTLVPMSLDSRIPELIIRIDNADVRVRLDTGASLFDTEDVYVNITRDTLETLSGKDPDIRPTAHLSGIGADGTPADLEVYTFASLRVGEHAFRPVHTIVQPPQGYFARDDALGFVSNNLLRRFGRVVIDYPGQRLMLPHQ